jgi:hypothetical protein
MRAWGRQIVDYLAYVRTCADSDGDGDGDGRDIALAVPDNDIEEVGYDLDSPVLCTNAARD